MPVARDDGRVAGVAEERLDDEEDVLVVVDDQDLAFVHCLDLKRPSELDVPGGVRGQRREELDLHAVDAREARAFRERGFQAVERVLRALGHDLHAPVVEVGRAAGEVQGAGRPRRERPVADALDAAESREAAHGEASSRRTRRRRGLPSARLLLRREAEAPHERDVGDLSRVLGADAAVRELLDDEEALAPRRTDGTTSRPVGVSCATRGSGTSGAAAATTIAS